MAAVKTKLTEYNLVMIGNRGHLFITDNHDDAKALEAADCAAVVVELDNGTSISNWTNNKGPGEWQDIAYQYSSGVPKNAHIAFTPFALSQDKTKKYLEALRASLSALGFYIEEYAIPNGKTLVDLMGKATTAEHVLDKIKQTIESDSGPAPLTTKDSEADLVLDIAAELFDFHLSKDEGPFLTLKGGPRVAYITSGGSPNLKSYLTNEYLQRYRSAVPKVALSDALNVIESICRETCDVVDLNYRKAVSAITGTVWFDLGRKDGQMVGINREGWWLSSDPDADVFFKRSSRLHELPLPTKCSQEDAQRILSEDFRQYFNISDEEFPLVPAWMVTHLVKGWQAPVAMFLGESGSGKTSATTAVGVVLEGTDDAGSIMPEKADDIAVTVASKSISLWNNVSFISKAHSDNICQYIDGASYEKRKLHSDNDVVELKLSPSILINGISLGVLNSDLKTRTVLFQLKPMKPSPNRQKRSLEEVKQDVFNSQSKFLGAVLTLTSQVLNVHRDMFIPEDGPRMPDYARAVKAVDFLWQLDGKVYEEYERSMKSLSSDALDHSLFQIIHNLVVQQENLQEDGTYQLMIGNKDLLHKFQSPYATDRWGSIRNLGSEETAFKNTNQMTAALNRAQTDWKHFGIKYENRQDEMIDGVRETRKLFIFDPAKSQSAWKVHEPVKY